MLAITVLTKMKMDENKSRHLSFNSPVCLPLIYNSILSVHVRGSHSAVSARHGGLVRWLEVKAHKPALLDVTLQVRRADGLTGKIATVRLILHSHFCR